MKKSLIVLGILAGITGVAHAENKTILSGSLGYSVLFDGKIDRDEGIGKNAKSGFDSLKDNVWDLNNSTAKFSISGNEDINDSLSAIYKFEFKVDKELFNEEQIAKSPQLAKFNSGVNETSKAYLGLKGSFGEVTLGKQSAAYGDAVKANMDNFNDVGSFDGLKIGNFNKGVKYSTSMLKEAYGIQLTGTIDLDGQDKASKGVDFWETAAVYNANGIYAGVGYQQKLIQNNGNEETMGTSVGYKNDAFKAGVGYAHRASTADSYNIGGEVTSGQNTFRAEANYLDKKKASNVISGSLGYQYNFSDRTYSWVEGQYQHVESSKEDGYKVAVGIRHDF